MRPTHVGAPQPSADAAAALAAGVLPCMTRLMTRLGAGRDDGTVWSAQLPFTGQGPCWAEVLLHGPLGQVAELVSAVGRRLRVVVEELRRAEAEGGHVAGRAVERAADAAVATMAYALYLVHCIVLEGLQAPPRPDANAALRFSWAAAELLPAVSHALLLCSKVCNGEGSAVGLERRTAAAEDSRPQLQTAGARLFEVLWSSGGILLFTVPLLARHSRAAAADMEQASGGDGGKGGGGDGSRCGDGGDGGASSGGSGSRSGSSDSISTSNGGQGGGACGRAAADHDTPWRQLLLRDVRLMEVLGAAAELHSEETVAVVAELGDDMVNWLGQPRAKLAHVLPLAAAAFPAEFRAAVGGGGADGAAGAGTGTGTGAGTGEGSRVAVGGAEAGATMSAKADAGAGLGTGIARGPSGAGRSAGGSSTARPCISPAAVHEALGTGAFGAQLGVVDRVLGGWDPTPGEVWDLVCSCCNQCCGLRREQLESLMPLLQTPAEARAAAAAVSVTAAPAAS